VISLNPILSLGLQAQDSEQQPSSYLIRFISLSTPCVRGWIPSFLPPSFLLSFPLPSLALSSTPVSFFPSCCVPHPKEPKMHARSTNRSQLIGRRQRTYGSHQPLTHHPAPNLANHNCSRSPLDFSPHFGVFGSMER
jgi:hypothetical protein